MMSTTYIIIKQYVYLYMCLKRIIIKQLQMREIRGTPTSFTFCYFNQFIVIIYMFFNYCIINGYCFYVSNMPLNNNEIYLNLKFANIN